MKQVIVVRSDLSMSKGKIAAQVGHACVNSIITDKHGDYDLPDYDDKVQDWFRDGMSKVVVQCKSEDELLYLIARATDLGVHTSPIRDAGRTEVDPSTLTCCAFGPDEDKVLDRITGALKLL